MSDPSHHEESELASPRPLSTPYEESQRFLLFGIYGLPGCGKSTLLKRLEEQFAQTRTIFREGSALINDSHSGGLESFRRLPEAGKVLVRRRAITDFVALCKSTQSVGVVVGHYSFWEDEHTGFNSVWTEDDAKSFTHILYLAQHPAKIASQRATDRDRKRSEVSEEHLKLWQEAEISSLRHDCLDAGIFFTPTPLDDAEDYLIRAFQHLASEYQTSTTTRLLHRCSAFIAARRSSPRTVLIIDGDKTLIPDQDTSSIFWTHHTRLSEIYGDDPPRTVFNKFGYTYVAFQQVAFLYEEIKREEADLTCDGVATACTIDPFFEKLILHAAAQEHIMVIVATCGLQPVFRRIIDQQFESISSRILLVGGRDPKSPWDVVTPEVKRALAKYMRSVHSSETWAFGDSPLDLPMLCAVSNPVIVAGTEGWRSRSMDDPLAESLESGQLSKARQILLPASSSTPRLNEQILPVIKLSESVLWKGALYHNNPGFDTQLLADDDSFLCALLRKKTAHSNSNKVLIDQTAGSNILATAMRNASLNGPMLRKAHEAAGRHLAFTQLSAMIGTEEFDLPHVNGESTRGHRLKNEHRTLIVALMRGGEPMALGVSEVFPTAAFLHAKKPSDLTDEHLRNTETVLLVDSVINTGSTMVDFMDHFRQLQCSPRVILVAGVVQADTLRMGRFADDIRRDDNFALVALRKSANKYVGSGATDTGNRLFNTIYMH